MKTLFNFGGAVVLALVLIPPADGRPRPNDKQPITALRALPLDSGGASPNDTARFLAGMPLDPHSPLAPLAQTPAWQEHAAFFENAFAKLTQGKFAKLHLWQDANVPELKDPIPVVY